MQLVEYIMINNLELKKLDNVVSKIRRHSATASIHCAASTIMNANGPCLVTWYSNGGKCVSSCCYGYKSTPNKLRTHQEVCVMLWKKSQASSHQECGTKQRGAFHWVS